MRITARQDIGAPIDEVFAAATDHAGFERQALRRGADVKRTDKLGGLVPGAAWRVAFPFRGREREVAIRVEGVEAPTRVTALAEGGGLAAQTAVELLALSRGTTRLTVTMEVAGRTLTARLLLTGMRLARASIERRVGERLAVWAREVEERSRRPAGKG